ncbi:MAG: hypothetical protein LWX56_02660 [Ignavibacteria bacterium]|nr:hypothetical protein [Ignavibacteria bacterium]
MKRAGVCYSVVVLPPQPYSILVLSVLFLIICSGCKKPVDIALNATKVEYNEGMKALQRITDQSELARVAKFALLYEMQMEAVQKIQDSTLLLDIALSSSYCANMAGDRIHDKKLLEKIVLSDSADTKVVREAVKKIENISLLAKVALEREPEISDIALISLFDKYSELQKYPDRNVEIVEKFIRSFKENTINDRQLLTEIFAIVRVLSDSEIQNYTGSIERFSLKAVEKSHKYYEVLRQQNTKMVGAREFALEITLSKMECPLCYRTKVDFPTGFSGTSPDIEKRVDAQTFLAPVRKKLPIELIGKINKKYSTHIL